MLKRLASSGLKAASIQGIISLWFVLSTISLAWAQVPLANPSFESPTIFEDLTVSPLPPGNGWIVRGNVSLRNGPVNSYYTPYVLEVPMGRQWVAMPAGSSISQNVTVSAGTYYITLHAAQFGGTSGQTLRVKIGGTTLPALTPDSTPGQLTSGAVALVAGTYMLEIEVADPVAGVSNGGIWLDNVALNTQGVNSFPMTAINWPIDSQAYADQTLNVVATASDPDGAISKVELYENGTLVGTAMQAPWVWARNYSSSGTKTLTVRAYDNSNQITISSPVLITHSAGTAKPFVANGGFEYSRAVPGTILPYGGAYPWAGFDSQGYSGIATSGTVTPYTMQSLIPAGGRQTAFIDPAYFNLGFYQYVNLPPGSYGLSFRAVISPYVPLSVSVGSYSGQLYSGSSGSIGLPFSATGGLIGVQFNAPGTGGFTPLTIDNVKIGPAGAPIVTAKLAAAGTTFTAPTAIRLLADIEVYDRTITQVQFLDGATVLFTGGSATTSYDWLNPTIGAHSITVKVTDSQSVVTTSSAVAVTVNAAASPAFFNPGFEYRSSWHYYGNAAASVPGWDVTPQPSSCSYCAIIAAKGSGWYPVATAVPEGVTVAAISGNGWIQQSVYMAAGDYKISFQTAQLNGGTSQAVRVLVNGVQVGTVTPGASFALFQSAQFTVSSSGHHVVRIESIAPGVTTYAGIDDLKILPQAPLLAAPVVSASFNPASVVLNGTSTLSFSIQNTNTTAITGVVFSANYPAGLTNSATPSPSLSGGGCLGSVGGAASGNTFSLTAGILPASTTCTYSVQVVGTTSGSKTVSSGAVTSANAPSGTAASSVLMVAAASVPGAPTIGTATAGNAQATVNFTAPASNGGSAITSYTATCGAQSASGAGSPITVTGLTNGTAVTCTVKATNAVGQSAASAASNSVTPTASVPGAPTIGTATAGNAQATVNFTAPASNGGSAITSYTATCGAQSASGAGSPITVTGLTNGTAVTCTVKATNAVGQSAASAASNSVTPTASVPGAPTIGTATAGNAQATVNFTAPASNGGSAITSYTATCGAQSASGAGSPITVTGLTNGTAVTCTVKATNAVGQSAASAASNSVTPTASVPGAPTIGTATAGNAQATVNFTAPASNGGSAITSYTATCGAQSASGAGSPITVTGLTNGTAVTCTVKATNAVGQSAASAASNSVTPTADGNGIASILANGSFEQLALEDGQSLSPMPSSSAWAVRGAVTLKRGPAVGQSAPYLHEVPIGRQWIFMQPGTAISQQVNLPTAGMYYISLQAAQAFGSTGQAIVVKMDGATVSTLTPGSTVAMQTFAAISLAAGGHELQIELAEPPAGATNGGIWLDGVMLNKQGTNTYPMVQIVAPTHGKSYPDQDFNVVATAVDPDGSISKVELYENGVLHSALTQTPWVWTRTYATSATRTLTVKAYDNATPAQVTTSDAVVITPSAGAVVPYLTNTEFEYQLVATPATSLKDVGANAGVWGPLDWANFSGVATAGFLTPNPNYATRLLPSLGRQVAFIDPTYVNTFFGQFAPMPAGNYGLSVRIQAGTAFNITAGTTTIPNVAGVGTYGFPFTTVGGSTQFQFSNAGVGGAPLYIEQVKVGPVGPASYFPFHRATDPYSASRSAIDGKYRGIRPPYHSRRVL